MIVQIKLSPLDADNPAAIEKALLKKSLQAFETFRIHRRSIDARSKKPWIVLAIELDPESTAPTTRHYPDVKKSNVVHIIGSGPAGYFAALKCIEKNLRPIIFERGKDVKTRRRDLRALQQFGIVHPDSNYCFGEGGAGTYSDGKLYTRSIKRGNVKEVLEILVDHGAKDDILIDAHPHIGSNKLPQIIQNIRKTIEDAGGEIHFDSSVTDIISHKGRVEKLIINNKQEFTSQHIILATGHSARDIFTMFDQKGWSLEYKPFAMGVRIEHEQPLIDRIQYGKNGRSMGLPAASYSLACQVEERGVFSFCMCPGGLIVPASTAPGELVVNGMSLSRRDSPFANSGTVVEVREEDMADFIGKKDLRGIQLQESIEQHVWSQGDGSQAAPAQRITDFIQGKTSSTLADTSYIPGIYSAPMHEILPDWMASRLKDAIHTFGRKMRGYFTENANLVGLESRTSSPVRIPRTEYGMHPDVQGLYPCGEGAGYAGGILSAAMDGQRVAEWIAQTVEN